MNISLHQLEIFLCIARERSFSRAAEQLRISQPSVSIQIKSLEQSLKVKLFERRSGRISVTREGAVVLERAKSIAEIVAGLPRDIEEATGVFYGRFSAGCSRVPSATLVPLAVARFKEQYPDTEMTIRTGRSHEVERWVLENEVDLGAIEGDPTSTLIVKEPWYVDELVLVLSPRSHLLKRHKLSLGEILEEPYLLQTPGIRPTFVERVLAARKIRIGKPITVGSREAVKAAIAAGYGVSIMPKSLVEAERRAGMLKVKRIHDLAVGYPVNMIYLKDKQLTKSALAFAELLKKQAVNLIPAATKAP
jgi:DNA-binding transcriptional LysR family regulator